MSQWPSPDDETTRYVGRGTPPDQQPTTRVPTGRPAGGPPGAPWPGYGPPPGHPAAPPPGWPPAGPGHPPPYPAGPPQAPRGTDGFAIASFVLSLFGGVLLSVVFGFVALGRIRRNGTGGRGLAVAGLVLSGLWVLVAAAVIVVVVTTGADRGPTGEVVGAGDTAAAELRAGDCIVAVQETASLRSVPVAPCATAHQGEVVAVFELPAGPYPAADELAATVQTRCSAELAAYAPSAAEDPAQQLFYIYPLQQNWERGDRSTICVAYNDPAVTGSLRGR